MATAIPIGAHVDQTDPIAEAAARQAPLVQFFLGDPQSYKGPAWAYEGGPEQLRADAEAAGVDLYVHAPYLVNVATTTADVDSESCEARVRRDHHVRVCNLSRPSRPARHRDAAGYAPCRG